MVSITVSTNQFPGPATAAGLQTPYLGSSYLRPGFQVLGSLQLVMLLIKRQLGSAQISQNVHLPAMAHNAIHIPCLGNRSLRGVLNLHCQTDVHELLASTS